ncbi:MAG: glycoside hydrolase family 15 protein [Chloroflexi bacterium]|nr:glycoside hydrolase family 15 protein [Chloroflexota bacterium]MCC6892848.1 glycoside hydrolase family 15 protein [Anaerolineae bacterium]
MSNLIDTSIAIILAGQSANGAVVASPTFSQYGYSWLRDGMWIAYGMDAAGEYDSARRFYRWAAETLPRYQTKADLLLAKLANGDTPAEADYLPTRFRLDGDLGTEDWPDFQLDGYGAWLWGLVKFVNRHNDDDLWAAARPAVVLLVRYLAALWQSPNYDCWEEHRQHIHPATLAAIYGGLNAVRQREPALVPVGLPEAVRDFVLQNAVSADGHFMKYLGNNEVDSSLLWIAVPYRLVEPTDSRFLATVAKIERDILRPDGGVYRYAADTYFGGGEWLLLTLWLAWAYIELGRRDEAAKLIAWVESQATAEGQLAEQVEGHVLDQSYFQPWVDRWGTSALPLLWSHGMYLLLKSLMKED